MSLQATSTLMYKEAMEAADGVAHQFAANADKVKTLAKVLKTLEPRAIVTCARGSSDHAASYAKYLFETQLGILTSSAALSVSSVYHVPLKLENTLFVVISQSGASPDLIATTEAAKSAGALVVALVNEEDSPIARLADHFIPLHAGPEKSVAATKSFIATLSAILHLTAIWSGNKGLLSAMDVLPGQLKSAVKLDWSPAVSALRDANNSFVIGRGLGFGIAQEAALKFKETSGQHAEAYSAAEVKHGPMAIVNCGFPVLIFTQDDDTRKSVENVIEAFLQRGAKVIVAGKSYDGAINLPSVQGVSPVTSPILKIQSFYLMVNALSIQRGYNPDRPPHLNKVTETT